MRLLTLAAGTLKHAQLNQNLPSDEADIRMTKYIVLTAVGADRPGIVHTCSRAFKDCGCNIVDSRMSVLGGEFAMISLLSGSWDSLAKLDDVLPRLQKELDLRFTARRTEERISHSAAMPYLIEVVAMDHPGIVHDIASFFSDRNISISDLQTGSYAAAHTGTSMFSMSMTVSVPNETSIGHLRGEFLEFCDQLNLDSVMEPVK